MTTATASTARPTLAEINDRPADEIKTFELQNYVVRYVTAVGSMNMAWSTYRSGVKVHYVVAELVVGYVGDFQPTGRQPKIGEYRSVIARCNTNGETGAIYKGLDTNAVNCNRCLPKKWRAAK